MNENCQENIAKVLIGCKSDLQQYIEISEQEANNLATEQGMPYVCTSAKAGTNVNEAFQTVIDEYMLMDGGQGGQNRQKSKKLNPSRHTES